MRVELVRNLPLTKHRPDIKKSVLYLYFEEDIFNDPDYAYGKEKYLALQASCEKAIKDNLEGLYTINKGASKAGDDIVLAGDIYFDINNVPDIKVDRAQSNFYDIIDMFRDLNAFATEQSLGITLERTGRKSFRTPKGPNPVIDAKNVGAGILEAFSGYCWGCLGFGAILPKEEESEDIIEK